MKYFEHENFQIYGIVNIVRVATEVTLAHHVEKAVDNTSDVDCVTSHTIVLDSALCQSPRHTRQANEIHAITILF